MVSDSRSLSHRLEQVVQGFQSKCLDRILIVGRGQDEVRLRKPHLLDLSDDAQAVQAGHLHVQEGQIRLQFLDEAEGLQTVLPGAQDLDIRESLEEEQQLVTSQSLVVDNDGAKGRRRAVCHENGSITFTQTYRSDH